MMTNYFENEIKEEKEYQQKLKEELKNNEISEEEFEKRIKESKNEVAYLKNQDRNYTGGCDYPPCF